MAARYDLRRSGQQYYWTLKAPNSETILVSEMYQSKASAEIGISSSRANSPYDSRYDRRTANNGAPYFVLRAMNNEVIGASETYSSVAAREAGIAACKLYGPIAPTEDNTAFGQASRSYG
jgi:uncharacterized protein